jgi:hypothetical protein
MSNQMPSEVQISEREVTPVGRPQGVLEKSKAVISDAWETTKFIWKDPANGLQEALTTLGEARAFRVGNALCALFVLACWIAILKVVSSVMGFVSLLSGGFGGGLGSGFYGTSFSGQLDISGHLRILLGIATPVAGMILILWVIRQLFKGVGNYKHFAFVTGVSLIPVTFFWLLLWLLGNSSIELMVLTGFFCFTTFILLLNTALSSVIQLSSRNALLLVPTLLAANLFITRVIFDILY